MKSRERDSGEESFSNKGYMQDLHRELEESKKSVKDLLMLRQALFRNGGNTSEQVNEYKVKAIQAINHLFNDELHDISE